MKRGEKKSGMHAPQRLRDLGEELTEQRRELTSSRVTEIGQELIRIADWLYEAGIREIPEG